MNQLTELRGNDLQASQSDMDLMMQQGGIDVWGILARRRWLIVLGLILGLGLGYIYLLQADIVYESKAQVLIENKKPPTITGMYDMGLSSKSEEEKHVVVLMSPKILNDAFETMGLRELPTFANLDNPMQFLRDHLSVDLESEGTNVINIHFRGPQPEDTKTVVEAIVETYKTFLTATYRDTGQDTENLIRRAHGELNVKREKLEKDYRELQAETQLMWRGDESVNIHSERQATYEAERIALEKEMAKLKAQIRSIQEAIDNDESPEAIALLAELDGTEKREDANLTRIKDHYLELLLEEETLTQRFGKDHPDVVLAQRRVTRFEELFPQVADNKGNLQSAEALLSYVKDYLRALKQREAQLRYEYQNLNEKFEEEAERAQNLQVAQFELQRLKDEIANTEQLFTVVVKSLEEITLVKDSEGYHYEEIAFPEIGEKVAPVPVKTMAISCILGMMAGFGLGYVVDISDKAFRTPDEVSQIMRLPVIGHIPLIDVNKTKVLQGSNITPVVVTVHRPKSPQAESYRAVRTALYFNNRDQRHQVIQVTSPMPGDGKSTLASNLAVTIAQSGKKVLIMDADFRRPTLHKVFGLDSLKAGLASVVGGDAEPDDVIQNLPEVPNLSLMACGPRPDNPSELLSSEEFEDFLGIMRQRFDFVLVDTPPVLAVSDPCAVAARVDGVLLTFRIHKRARPLATRARDTLTEIGANIIGVVVNGIDQESGGSYNSYRYGYGGYRYAYNYRYGYGTYGSEEDERNAIRGYYDEDRNVSRVEAEELNVHQS